MLVESYGIFHKRRRKIMALIPLKARAGIAAFTFTAVAGAVTCGGRCILFSTGRP
jgi:hypothetical protein